MIFHFHQFVATQKGKKKQDKLGQKKAVNNDMNLYAICVKRKHFYTS